MKIVSETMLKDSMSEYFREIEATGEEVLVTDHGEMVLKIISYRRETDTPESPPGGQGMPS